MQSHAKNPLAALPAAAETCRCFPERGTQADGCAVALGLGKPQPGGLSPLSPAVSCWRDRHPLTQGTERPPLPSSCDSGGLRRSWAEQGLPRRGELTGSPGPSLAGQSAAERDQHRSNAPRLGLALAASPLGWRSPEGVGEVKAGVLPGGHSGGSRGAWLPQANSSLRRACPSPER